MHLRSTRLFSALLIAVLLIAGIVPSAFASIPAKVSSSSAVVYKSASSSAECLRVPKNLKVSITSVSGSWAQVKYKGRKAYMPMTWLSPTSRVKGYATGSTAVYNSSGKKLGTLSRGTGVYVLGTVNGGYCVMNTSGTIGYVKSGTLSNKQPAASTNKSSSSAAKKLTIVDKALIVAKSLIGKKYSMHDNPPSSFNCSSFVQYCYGKAGRSMKGTAATQAADGRYKKVGLSGIRTGDVLFFDTTGNGQVDHSAIYIGSNKFVEASRNAGRVQVNSLTSWYKQHFICARRP